MPERSLGRLLGEFDFALAGAAFCLVGAGLVTLARLSEAADTPYFLRQIAWTGIGLGILLVAVSVDYLFLARFARVFYAVSLGSLVYLLLFGKVLSGAKRWLALGPMSFQPAEAAKLAAILMASVYLAEREEERRFTRKKFLTLSVIFGAPSVLTALQPDLGSALSFVPIYAAFLFVAGADWRWFLGLALSLALIAPVAWLLVLKDYQKARVVAFVNPQHDPQGSGYQLLQSKIAVGSGGLAGQERGRMTLSSLRFIPAQHTDFIFAAYAEARGLLGVSAVLAAYGFILFRILRISQMAKDSLGFFVSTGVFALVAFQAVLNMGMVIGFFPITGLPLPWFSYGGSAMAMFMAALGLVLNVKMRRFVN
jgi:rod shape determining protein RodA